MLAGVVTGRVVTVIAKGLSVSHFLEVSLSDGEAILVQVTEQVDGLTPVGRARDVVGQLPEALTAGLDRVQKFAGEVLTRMRSYPQPPDRLAIEFVFLAT